jgi:predicted RNA-binding Zn ribbon-like protein
MATATAYPRLTDHNGEGWHLHYRDANADTLPQVLFAVISVGTALHLTTRGMHRLGRCAAGRDAADSCTNVVVDITRTGRQRYCSVRCANRAAVRRHRARAAEHAA